MSELGLLQDTIRAALRDGLVLCEPVSLPARDGAPPSELRIAPAGTWSGHPSGPVEINEALAETVQRNLIELGFRPPVDERHRTAAQLISAPRYGSVGRYEWRDAALWACDIQWNERGRKSWENDDYGYVSMGMLRNLQHPRTGRSLGPVMTHLSLTNTPFFGGAAALAEGLEQTNMDVTELIEKLKADAALRTEVLATLGITPTPEAPRTVIPRAVLAEYGLAETATEQDLEQAIAGRRTQRAQAIVAAAVAAGRVPKDPESALHQALCELAEANPDAVQVVVAAMPMQAPNAAGAAPADRQPAEQGAAELSEEQKRVNAELGITDEDWKKYGVL